MRLRLASLVLLAAAVGCSQPKLDEPQNRVSEDKLFNPMAMRIHPIFTEVKDWTGDDKPDGIECLVEFQDQFGDPTKAAGTIMFELFDYRQANPEPRGARLVNPWIGSMTTLMEQRARWNRTSRTYTFQLAYPQVRTDRDYVLTATFRSSNGPRFDDRVILAAQPEEIPATQPSTRPATQPSPIFPPLPE